MKAKEKASSVEIEIIRYLKNNLDKQFFVEGEEIKFTIIEGRLYANWALWDEENEWNKFSEYDITQQNQIKNEIIK